MIRTSTDLAEEVGVGRPERIARALYIGTESGVRVVLRPDGVSVRGFAEGCADLPAEVLRYPFPASAFWDTVRAADQQACDLFEANLTAQNGQEDCE